jgi:hypothetical protein
MFGMKYRMSLQSYDSLSMHFQNCILKALDCAMKVTVTC